jgi:hypothetical protein
MPKKTPAQHFANLFALFTAGATEGERAAAERKMDGWLKRNGKTRADIRSILDQATVDDTAAAPPPPPSDPRDDAPHPFDDPQFTPAGLVEGIVAKYLTMEPYVRVIYVLSIIFTHVFQRFAIAPRVALVSEDIDSGKSTALEVARHLVLRPSPEALATGAAIGEFIDEGPGTPMLDDLDHVDTDTRRMLLLIWNLGYLRGAKRSLVIRGKRKLVNLHAPMMAAGVGGFLASAQKSRTFELEMFPFTAETAPERDYWAEEDFSELNTVYSYLRHWAPTAKLNLKPAMPPGMIRRSAQNVRGLLSIADSCGPEWGRRAREAVVSLFEKGKAERPEVLILHHTLAIMDTLEVDAIKSTVLDTELRRLDLPNAQWNRYRGPGGGEYAHPITAQERAGLLRKPPSNIEPKGIRPPVGKQFRGYRREWIVEALRRRGAKAPAHLRLITPRPNRA